ncbi:MAG TPA: hypothetical protein VF342_05080 [Alphaproteobacteria bacterium]
MKNTLMAAAAAVALMAGMSAAQADGLGYREDPIVNAAVALSGNAGFVVGTLSGEGFTEDTNYIKEGAFSNTTGLANVNQNNGAHAVSQNSMSLSAILGCECDDSLLNITVAGAGNVGAVALGGTLSIAARNSNSISYDAFKGATGLFNVNQNNGAASVSQNSMSVAAIIH